MKTVLVLFILISVEAVAQEATDEMKRLAYGNPFTEANQDAINMLNRTAGAEQVNFFMFETWMPMESMGRDSTVLTVDSANYNIEMDQIIFRNEGRYYSLFPEKIFYARIGDKIFVNRPYLTEKKRAVTHFFEVLAAGEYTLLCRYEIKKEIKNDHPMGLPAARETTYSREKEFYFFRENARVPEPVPTKRQDFIMIFRKHRPEMVIYAKENKTSLRDGEDLARIFSYYNSLAEGS